VRPTALVVVGASAGGVEALRALVARLPANLDAAVLVVLHTAREGPRALPKILGRAGPLPAKHAVDGEALEAGRIYVAPPTTTCSSSMDGCGCPGARPRTATARRSTRCSGPRPGCPGRGRSRWCCPVPATTGRPAPPS
jgi:two-component system chemotaxis response regulator CheB